VADPYAERPRTHTGSAPAGAPPWAAPVAERGGLVLASGSELDGGARPETGFVAVRCRGAGLLPPILRPSPAQAAVLLALHAEDAPLSGPAVNRARDRLAGLGVPLYAIKHGWVAGPPGEPGAIEVDASLIAAVLDADTRGEVGWERDPDFAYEVAAAVPGVEGEGALALCPRLLYAAHDRVYEHADLVVEVKRERGRVIAAAAGADAEIVAASGWPIEPTGQGWKD
jgi:hypothetical protein